LPVRRRLPKLFVQTFLLEDFVKRFVQCPPDIRNLSFVITKRRANLDVAPLEADGPKQQQTFLDGTFRRR